ncbi:MAG: tRNA (guanosine(46)-N7)-methyltransferase TrmB [Planctomycetaceae bacterium]|nr:tRNA (guanosine(46)-N7)-methyltransferase TrmB [Planctomycetaceae bacterium]
MQTAPVKPMKPWFQVIQDIGDQLDWQAFFGNDNPVELDIGCGRGLYLFNASTTRPDTNFVGMEIDYREGRRAAARLMKRQQPNARVIGGDCKILLEKMIAPHSVEAAHVYFPDPWWKKRHHKRRLFTDSFVDLLARVVRPGGHVHSWTDVAEYFEVISELMNDHSCFESQETPTQREAEHDLDYQTSFERKKRKLGLPIYRGLWRRRAPGQVDAT